jgi:tetratricopeptide (TPR) repeat protein
MNRVPLVFVFCLVLLAKGATPASADSAVTFVRKFLTGKALDYIWDQASGTPDVKLLDRRLRELEGNTATRVEVRDEVRRLRQRIHAKVSRDEFQKLAEETSQQILSISQRLDELEERVERLEVEQEDAKKGTTNASSPAYFVSRGNQFAQNQQPHRALANYALALRLNPANELAHEARCRLYENLKAWDVVVVTADQAIGAVPSEFKGRFYRLRALAGTQRLNLKLIHLALRPQEDFIRGIPPEEGFAHVGSLLLALNHYPKDAELHLGRGIGALWMAHTAKPTWKLQSLAAEEVNRFNQEKSKLRQSLHVQARTSFASAIDADPTCYRAYCGRGLATYLLEPTPAGRKAAIGDFTLAISLAPRLPEAYALRGWARSGEPAGIADLTQAIELDPDDKYLLLERASQYSLANDHPNAIADCERILKLNAEFSPAHERLSSHYYSLGNRSKGRYHADRAEEFRDLRRD